MAEVFAILGAAETTVTILSSFINLVSRYRALQTELFDAQLGIAAVSAVVDRWRRKWDVTKGTLEHPESYYTTLFGVSGWTHIKLCLGRMDGMMKEVNKDIDQIVRKTLSHGRIPLSRLYNDRYNSVLVEKAIRNINNNMSVGKHFRWAMMNKAQDLQSQVRALNGMLINLERFSDSASEEQYPRVFGHRGRHQGDNRLRIYGPTQEEGKRMQADAADLHKASNIVGSWIGLTPPRDLGRRSPSRSPSPKPTHNFEIVVKRGRYHEQLLVEPVRFKRDARPYSNVASALASFHGPNERGKAELLPPGTPPEYGFILSLDAHGRLCRIADNANLATLLSRRRTIGDQQSLSLQDRISICCSLIEGCFRFLGSQWLDNLDVSCLKGESRTNGSWTMILGDEDADASTTRVLREISASARAARDRQDLTKHCQIFRLGLILTELALKTPISWIETNDTRRGAKIRIRSIQEEPLSAADIAEHVEAETNSKLISDATFFCLSSLQSASLISDDRVGEKYYRKALQPSQSLSNALIQVRDRDRI